MKVVSFKVDEELDDMLKYYAHKKNISKSEVIRRAIRSYIMSSNDRPFITRRIKIYN